MNFIENTMSLFVTSGQEGKTAAYHGWAHFSSPGGRHGA